MKKLVFVCIGISSINGDSIGPKLGSRLKNIQSIVVYGTEKDQINNLNYLEFYKKVKQEHKDDIVIAIDAALGEQDIIGSIIVRDGGVKPGAAFFSDRESIGDIGLLAVVGNKQKDRKKELEKVTNKTVKQMVDKLFNLINEIVCSYYYLLKWKREKSKILNYH